MIVTYLDGTRAVVKVGQTFAGVGFSSVEVDADDVFNAQFLTWFEREIASRLCHRSQRSEESDKQRYWREIGPVPYTTLKDDND